MIPLKVQTALPLYRIGSVSYGGTHKGKKACDNSGHVRDYCWATFIDIWRFLPGHTGHMSVGHESFVQCLLQALASEILAQVEVFMEGQKLIHLKLPTSKTKITLDNPF